MSVYTLAGNGATYTSSKLPVFSGGLWQCADADGTPFNIMDINGDLSVATVYPILTPVEFMLAFTAAEQSAIMNSTDPTVKVFWFRFQMALQSSTPIDPNTPSIIRGLQYLALPANGTPPGPGILASSDRIAEIQAGIAQ